MAKSRQPLHLLAGCREIAESIRRALPRVPADLAIWADVRAFPPLAVIAGLDCVAALVLWRKYSGGPAMHLTNGRLCVAAFGIAALAVTGRWWLARIERQPPALWLRALLSGLGALPMLILLSLANSHHSPWAVSFVSALAVVSGGVVLLWNRLASAPAAAVRSPAQSAVALRFPTATFAPPVPAPERSSTTVPGTAFDPPVRPDSDAWMTRTIDESGAAKLRGSVHAEFAAGQTIATIHVSFSPAFLRTPEFSCEVVDAPAIRARTPAVYRYGARVELKRSGDSSSPARAEIRFHACAAHDVSHAA